MWGSVPFVPRTLSPVPGPVPRSATLVASDIMRTTVTFKSVPQATLFPCLLVIFFWKSSPVCPTGSQIPCEMELIAPPLPLNWLLHRSLRKVTQAMCQDLSSSSLPTTQETLSPIHFSSRVHFRKPAPFSSSRVDRPSLPCTFTAISSTTLPAFAPKSLIFLKSRSYHVTS